MPDEDASLLGRIMDAFFTAEFCPPEYKAEAETVYLNLLSEASQKSGKSVGVIKEAILRARYHQYRKDRLKRELGSVPPSVRDQ